MGSNSTSPFVASAELTAITIAFRNPAYKLIADLVMPRVNPVLTKKEFTYIVYDLAAGYTVPDLAVGRIGRPAEASIQGAEMPGKCEDYGVDLPVPQDDIDQAKGSATNPLGFAVEHLTNLMQLGREMRVAGITFNAASYAAANVQTLAGTDRFSDLVNSDPVGVISEMLDTPLLRPNCLTFGKAVCPLPVPG